MKIIDSHMHFSNIASFRHCAEQSSMLDYSAAGYEAEAKECGIVRSICMGLTEAAPGGFPDSNAEMPMLADLAKEVPAGIAVCAGINPHTLNNQSLERLEAGMRAGNVVGVKIYAGYYHADVFGEVYEPVYKLAQKYDLAVAVHTGDTYSDRGLLSYSHPLNIDRLAVGHPGMRIIICHVGAPWVFDACEVAGKNPNVYIDISGLLEGDAAYVASMAEKPLLLDRYRQPFVCMDNYSKLLFGTDWPLVPMKAYIDFCKKLIPDEAHEDVFYKNAVKVFRL